MEVISNRVVPTIRAIVGTGKKAKVKEIPLGYAIKINPKSKEHLNMSVDTDEIKTPLFPALRENDGSTLVLTGEHAENLTKDSKGQSKYIYNHLFKNEFGLAQRANEVVEL